MINSKTMDEQRRRSASALRGRLRKENHRQQDDGAPFFQQSADVSSRRQLSCSSEHLATSASSLSTYVQTTARAAYTNHMAHLPKITPSPTLLPLTKVAPSLPSSSLTSASHSIYQRKNIMKQADGSRCQDTITKTQNDSSYQDGTMKPKKDPTSDQGSIIKRQSDLAHHYQGATTKKEEHSSFRKTTSASRDENTNETKNSGSNMMEGSPLMDLRESRNIGAIATPDHGREGKSGPSSCSRILDSSKMNLLTSPMGMVQLLEGKGGQSKELLTTRERQNEEQHNNTGSGEISLGMISSSRDRSDTRAQGIQLQLPLSLSNSPASTSVVVASERRNTFERRSLVISPPRPRSRTPRDNLKGGAFEDQNKKGENDRDEDKSRQAAVPFSLSQPAAEAGNPLASSAFSFATSRWKGQAPVGSEEQSLANSTKPHRHCRLARSLSRPARFVAATACARVAGGIHQQHKGDDTKADADTADRSGWDGETEGGPPAGLEGSKGQGYDSNKASRDLAWLLDEKKDLTLRTIQSSIFNEVSSSKAASVQDNPSTTTTATGIEQNVEQDSASFTSPKELKHDGAGVISSRGKSRSRSRSDRDPFGGTDWPFLSSDGTASQTQDRADPIFHPPSEAHTAPQVKESCEPGSKTKIVTTTPGFVDRIFRQNHKLPVLTKPEALFSFFQHYAELKQHHAQLFSYSLEKGYFVAASDFEECIKNPQDFARKKKSLQGKGAQRTAATIREQDSSPGSQQASSLEPSPEPSGLLAACFLSAPEVCFMGEGSFGGVWSSSEGLQCHPEPAQKTVVKHQLDLGEAMVEACFAIYVSRQENLAQYVAQAYEAVSFIPQVSGSQKQTGNSFLLMDKYSRDLKKQVLGEVQVGESPLKAGISLRNSAAERPVQTSSTASPRPLEEATGGAAIVAKRFIKRGNHMIEGIVELGKLGIASRDIKLENYLIGDEALESPRLSDWGLSTASGRDTAEMPLVGTPLFLDPLALLLRIGNYRDWISANLYPEAGAQPTYIQMDAWSLGDALLDLWTSQAAREKIIGPSFDRVYDPSFSSSTPDDRELAAYATKVAQECAKDFHPATRAYYSEQMQEKGAKKSTVFSKTVLELLLRYPLNCSPDKRDMAEFADLWGELLVEEMEKENMGNLNNEVVNEDGLEISQDATKDQVKGMLRKAAGLADTLQAPSRSSTLQAASSASTSRSTPEETQTAASTLRAASSASTPGSPGPEGATSSPSISQKEAQSFEESNQHQVAASSQSTWRYEALQASASSETPSHEHLAGAGNDVGAPFDATGAMTTDITAKGAGGTVRRIASSVETGPGADNANDAMGGADNPSTTTSATTVEAEGGSPTAAAVEKVEVGTTTKPSEGQANNVAGSERAGKKAAKQSKLLRREDR
ncbi:unnamed protein product [Amoebophrya sp. A25]|nr:unnamed protein product [Amoebophrya sp. A25]|eukprot:GSA25T00008362001.1